MSGKDLIERRRERAKPRGRPFAKGNNKGKVDDEVLDDTGLASGDEGGALTPTPESVQNGRTEHEEDGMAFQLPKKACEVALSLHQTIKENMNTTQEKKPSGEDDKNLELIDSIDFMHGENKLSLRFSKRTNRMYRIQIFLNDTYEIRPTTYSGISTGLNFWNFVKGVFKK